jgi:hypothetical protein
VVSWLCTDPGADAFIGQTIEAQNFCHERGLMPDWEGPHFAPGAGSSSDLSGYKIGRGEKLYS